MYTSQFSGYTVPNEQKQIKTYPGEAERAQVGLHIAGGAGAAGRLHSHAVVHDCDKVEELLNSTSNNKNNSNNAATISKQIFRRQNAVCTKRHTRVAKCHNRFSARPPFAGNALFSFRGRARLGRRRTGKQQRSAECACGRRSAACGGVVWSSASAGAAACRSPPAECMWGEESSGGAVRCE